MTTHRLEKDNFYIRSLHVSEVSQVYVDWLNDPAVNEFLESRYTTWTLESCKQYVARFEESKTKFIFGIYNKKTNVYIGNGSISNVNHNTGTFTLALFIGDKYYWGANAGMEVTLLLLKFGFDHLKMRKFFGGAYSNQLASRFILKKIGAVEEAILKAKFMYKGKPVDQVVYSVDQEGWQVMRQKFNLGN